MKRIIPFILLLCIGCKQKLPGIPSSVIPIEKMKYILVDMHIADGVSQTKAQGGVNEKQLIREYYAQIYKNNGVTEQDYIKSYHFYEDNPALLNKLYEDVLTEMSKVEAIESKDSIPVKQDKK
ncbi:MAG: putative lipoprotein [Bacteroidota bacterium]|nr:putative lipoprotein [Bacteroidota bacterium]